MSPDFHTWQGRYQSWRMYTNFPLLDRGACVCKTSCEKPFTFGEEVMGGNAGPLTLGLAAAVE